MQKIIHYSINQIRQHSIKCGVIVSRIPQITKTPNKLESEYWNYFNNKEDEQALPFSQELYFKKGSLNERLWNERQNEGYIAEEGKDIFDNKVKMNNRITEADNKNDIKSLERKLEDKLYLLIKKDNEWILPYDNIDDRVDSLSETAKALMHKQFGDNLDLFWIGKAPIGHIDKDLFFMKAHILAGKIEGNNEYAWLNKHEIQLKVKETYFNQIKDLL